MKRRILSILLLAAMMIGLLPQGMLSVSAYSETDVAYPVEGGNLYFDKATGTITDCDNSVTGADIPAQIDGVTVTSIGESAFENCSSLTSVTVPESVTSIGNYGFYFCGNLQSVYFMGDAPELGNNVFDISNIWYDEPVIEIEDISIRGLVLYYLEVKEGWTTPTWNGYPTEIWERENEPDPAADEIAYPAEGGNLYFRKSTGEIFNCDQTVTKADIPVEINGVAVTKIGVDGLGCGAFENCAALTEVTIPNSVTEISDYAFSGCTALMSVTIPDSVTSIGKRAFYWCDSLTSVTLPSSVTSIDEYTFSRCGKLTNITIPNSVTSINYGAFSCCSSLTSVTIPESVTSIGFYAFSECTGLTSVTIPESVTNIPASAFNGCSSLTDVTVPSSVTVIKISAFEDCTGLQSVYFMGDAPVLEENAFSIWDTEAQTYINNPDLTLYYIEGKANWTTPTWNGYPTATWDGVNVPVAYPVEGGNLYFRKSTGEIYDCDETVTAADIPSEIDGVAVTGIGYRAFESCHGLVSVMIPNSVTNIKLGAFGYCSRLTSVTIPNSVTSIGRYAFCECSSLTSVTIPDSVTSIGDSAFAWCNSLRSVTIPDSVTSIGDSVFSICSSLTAINVAEKNTAYASENGVLFNKSQTILLCYPMGKTDTEYSVPNCVTSIYDSAFSECSSLTNVTIPDSVTSIGNSAFGGCSSLTSVTIPDSVTSIDDWAFYDCSSLQSVRFIGDAPALGENVFSIWNDETQTYINNPNLILYYIDGKGGWTTPFWKGYPTATWMPVHEHSYVAAVIAPTCTERGCTTHTCSICCDTYTDTYTDALGHDYGDWTQTKAPTCTEKGEEKRICSRCDAFEVREIAAHGHTEVIAPAVPATCTEAGLTEGKHCSVCGTVLVAQETVAALGHDYGDWTQTKAPTCTEKGEEKRTCSRCDACEVREIAAHGHTEIVDAAIPATCTEAGLTEGKHCSVCGTVLVAQETVAALGHDYGDWTQTKAPTCTEKGEEKRTCSRCDAVETREIAAHGHTEVVDPAVPATCTEAGKTEGKHCAVCGTVLVAQETVPALGHSYKDGVCTVCGAKDPDAQPAAPVEFSDVSEKAWYYEAVEYAVENGLMNGVGGGKFDPEGTMTRAMLVTVLWRYEGEPAEGENSFTDVPNGTWYTEAVAWAAANGIVGGVGNGKFDPNGIITREQMATILFRYAQKRGFDTSKRGDLSVFPDSGKVSSWAKDAMRWAVAEKIITGSDGYLLPQGNATRAQVAALLMRFVNKIEAGDEVTELPVDPKHVVTAGTRKAYIGMSLEDLSEHAGEPEEILSTTAGYTWYVYGTKDYTDYVMAGVYENKVVAICASGADFSYRGCTANGSEAAAEADDTYSINVLKDKNDNSAVYGILLTDKKFRVQYAETKEALAGESRVAFHMANAFRVLHGVGILTWCDKAATAARLHSEDMATQNYVSHTSADGRLFYMRLRENGVLYNTCAENLCAGYYSGVGAHNAWVNSALHRANLLNASMDRCGVGFAYELNSDYRYYAVSDYYQAR